MTGWIDRICPQMYSLTSNNHSAQQLMLDGFVNKWLVMELFLCCCCCHNWFPIAGRVNLVYYEILVLQDSKHLNTKLWKPVVDQKKMPTEQGLYGVKRRFYLPPKVDDDTKDYVRWGTEKSIQAVDDLLPLYGCFQIRRIIMMIT